MSTCCGCVPLKAGGWIISFIEFWRVLYTYARYFPMVQHGCEDDTKICSIIIGLIVKDSISLAFALLFISGLWFNRSKLILPVIVWSIISIVIQFGLYVLELVAYFERGQIRPEFTPPEEGEAHGIEHTIFLGTEVTFLGIYVYFIFVKWQIYKQIRLEQGYDIPSYGDVCRDLFCGPWEHQQARDAQSGSSSV